MVDRPTIVSTFHASFSSCTLGPTIHPPSHRAPSTTSVREMTQPLDVSSRCTTTRRSRYYQQPATNLPVKVLRPTLLTLPYPLLGWIFVLSQNPKLLQASRATRELGQDPLIRAQFLAYRTRSHPGSFFVACLRTVPPVEDPIFWEILKNRHMLDEPLGSDVFREMRAKEDRFKMDASFWTAHPHCRQIVLTWMQEDFSWDHDTRYMAIAALDRYVSLVKHVEVEEIQLIAGACLFIANKCEELWPVTAGEMAAVSQTTPKALFEMECRIMKTLNWQVATIPTPEWFLSYFFASMIPHTPRPYAVLSPPLSLLTSPSSSPSASPRTLSRSSTPSPLALLAGSVLDDVKYRQAIEVLDAEIMQPIAVSVAPSALAAWVVWQVLVLPRHLAVHDFECCTEYSVEEMARLDSRFKENALPLAPPEFMENTDA